MGFDLIGRREPHSALTAALVQKHCNHGTVPAHALFTACLLAERVFFWLRFQLVFLGLEN